MGRPPHVQFCEGSGPAAGSEAEAVSGHRDRTLVAATGDLVGSRLHQFQRAAGDADGLARGDFRFRAFVDADRQAHLSGPDAPRVDRAAAVLQHRDWRDVRAAHAHGLAKPRERRGCAAGGWPRGLRWCPFCQALRRRIGCGIMDWPNGSRRCGAIYPRRGLPRRLASRNRRRSCPVGRRDDGAADKGSGQQSESYGDPSHRRRCNTSAPERFPNATWGGARERLA